MTDSDIKLKGLSVLVSALLLIAALPVGADYYLDYGQFADLFGPTGCIEASILLEYLDTATKSTEINATMGMMTTPTQHESNDTKTESKNESLNQLLANNKEKTPMCLVNELARYNEIQHQYRLTDEQGPAHRKQFTVTLSLGDEEYSAEGASIKKAQHQAASYALVKTKYNHPPPKPLRSIRKNNITPTVELNAWAMKRGEQATYHFLPPNNPALAVPAPLPGGMPAGVPPAMGPGYMPPPGPPPPGPPPGPPPPGPPPAYNHYNGFNGYRPPYQMPFEYPRRNVARPYAYYDKMRRYVGNGQVPAGLTMTGMAPLFSVKVKVGSREFIGEGPTAQVARHAAASKALAEIRMLPLPDEKCNRIIESNSVNGKDENGTDVKSPISLVHEVALRHKYPVSFEVVNMTGPPHMRSFRTVCIVGDWKTEGVGNSKKISKKRASEAMLEQLKTLDTETAPVISPGPRLKKKNSRKKKPKNLIKEPKQATPNTENPASPSQDEVNPISRLIHIQIAKKEPEPVYTLITESGAPRNREFTMSVEVGDKVERGTGPNKRVAKRAAAEAMLRTLGYSRPSDTNSRTTERGPRKNAGSDKSSVGGTSGRQLVPGLLLMSDSYKVANPKGGDSLMKDLNSRTDTAKLKPQGTSSIRSKDQLEYLAKLFDLEVQFTDFPKGNHLEYLSLCTLSTVPPLVCHGAGESTEASHDQAAMKALSTLSEMGLDSVYAGNLKNDSSSGGGGGGDGVQVSSNFIKGGVIFEDPKHS